MVAHMNDQVDPTSQEAEGRGSMYRFLATVYLQPPTEDIVRAMDRAFVEEFVAPFSTQAAAELSEYVVSLDSEKEIFLLKQEYMDLFAVPAGRYVTPFEDVYRGIRQDGKQEGGPLLGDRAVAAKIMYRTAGAEIDKACKELPTHIGVELSFMSFLCEREAAALDNVAEAMCSEEQSKPVVTNIYRHTQMRFLQEHLNDWFPQLNQVIQAKAKTPFYRALGQLTKEYLAWDMANLMLQLGLEEAWSLDSS